MFFQTWVVLYKKYKRLLCFTHAKQDDINRINDYTFRFFKSI